MEKYFLVTDTDNETLGVFEYSTNENADRQIMQMVCGHYCVEDCDLDFGFEKPNNMNKVPLKRTVHFEENGEPTYSTILIREIAFYKKGPSLNFTNELTSYLETHFEIVSEITRQENVINSKVSKIAYTGGTGSLYELAKELTDKFEKDNEGREWDGEFFDEMEAFLETELN